MKLKTRPAHKQEANFVVRDMKWDDYDHLNAICTQLRQDMVRATEVDGPKGLVALRGNELVGGLVYDTDGNGKAKIETLVVAERWQEQGVGKTLMEKFFEKMRGARVTEVQVRARNTDAERYYEVAHGFKPDRSHMGAFIMMTKKV